MLSLSINLNPTGALVSPPVLTPLSPDKATTEGGQWKRKKGPAPPRPIPQKRQVKKLPRKAVNTELHDIEVSADHIGYSDTGPGFGDNFGYSDSFILILYRYYWLQ